MKLININKKKYIYIYIYTNLRNLRFLHACFTNYRRIYSFGNYEGILLGALEKFAFKSQNSPFQSTTKYINKIQQPRMKGFW
jgi:hypothetical protein